MEENEEIANILIVEEFVEVNETEDFLWTEKATLLLLNEYKKRNKKFRDPKIKKKNVWVEIETEMNNWGYNVTWEMIDRKFRNLKHAYKIKKDNDNKKKRTGTGRVNWKYYDIMSDIFQEDKTINPNVLMSSINTTVLNQEDDHLSKRTRLDTILDLNEDSIPATPLHTNLINILQSDTAPQTLTKHNSKRTGQSRLDFHRKSIREIEKGKLDSLNRLCEAVEENNNIQRKKNEILEQLLGKENT